MYTMNNERIFQLTYAVLRMALARSVDKYGEVDVFVAGVYTGAGGAVIHPILANSTAAFAVVSSEYGNVWHLIRNVLGGR